jgi:hypothetical protein
MAFLWCVPVCICAGVGGCARPYVNVLEQRESYCACQAPVSFKGCGLVTNTVSSQIQFPLARVAQVLQGYVFARVACFLKHGI